MTRLSKTIDLHDFHRYVLIYGAGVGDIFFYGKGEQTDFLHALTYDLQSKGYQRILHLSPTQPVHLLDPNSEKLAENHLWNMRKEVLNAGIVQELKVGPYGPVDQPKNHTKFDLKQNGLGDVHGFRLIDEMIKEKNTYRTALIIYNAEVFLTNFSDKRILGGIFSEWLQLPLENQNTIFFVFTNSNLEDLIQTIKSIPIPELKSFLDDSTISATGQFRINGPDSEEIVELIEYLKFNQQVEFNIQNSNLFYHWIENEGELLRTWFDRFSFETEITLDTVKKKGWFSASQGDSRSFEQKLENLVGLIGIKERILEIRDWMRFQENEIRPDQSPILHMVFYGNPGTGKTTLARLMGEMFHDYGVLSRGHIIEVNGSDLVAEIVGGTAIKTNRVIDRALDGVLFIDEAYTLSSKERGGFGQEAIETLLVRMENYRSRLVVILAGYPNKMREFLSSNPGLDRRFPKENRFEFEDFSSDELEEILKRELAKRNISCEASFEQLIPEIIKHLSGTGEESGNAGYIRNFVDGIERRSKARAFNENQKFPLVSLDDLPEEFQENRNSCDPNKIISEFEFLVGLENIKSYLVSLIKLIQLEKLRYSQNHFESSQSMLENFIFLGNPGTGKTTIARMIGRIYKNLGLLRRGHCIEVSAVNLIAGYVGQTQEKTKDVILNALDGVLFIDEAHTLTRNQSFGSANYGQEAIDLLVKYMEDYRSRLIVIAAGYPDEMVNFLSSNPGLRSRFGSILQFEDFTKEEIEQILYNLMLVEGYECNSETMNEATNMLANIQSLNPKNFGNARDVRRLFFYMKRRLAERIFSNLPGDKQEFDIEKDINTFIPSDVFGFDQTDPLSNAIPYVLPQSLQPIRKKF